MESSALWFQGAEFPLAGLSKSVAMAWVSYGEDAQNAEECFMGIQDQASECSHISQKRGLETGQAVGPQALVLQSHLSPGVPAFL